MPLQAFAASFEICTGASRKGPSRVAMGDGVDRDDVVACRRKLRGNTEHVGQRARDAMLEDNGRANPPTSRSGINWRLWDKSDGL